MTMKSDLDLVIHMPNKLSKVEAYRLFNELTSAVKCRLDIQLETPKGAIALGEWATNSSSVLIKTDSGPFLTETPWE
jgi:phosphoribosyl-dephospho-CoA transferase